MYVCMYVCMPTRPSILVHVRMYTQKTLDVCMIESCAYTHIYIVLGLERRKHTYIHTYIHTWSAPERLHVFAAVVHEQAAAGLARRHIHAVAHTVLRYLPTYTR